MDTTITKIETLGDLKIFLESLSAEQLTQAMRIALGESPFATIAQAEVLNCDHINPGEGIEPISDYQKDGVHYDPDYYVSEQDVVAKAGEIFFYGEASHE